MWVRWRQTVRDCSGMRSCISARSRTGISPARCAAGSSTTYKLPQVTINNEKCCCTTARSSTSTAIRIECFLVPGHTWGHMVYLIDDKYLFTGDTIWFGADGGYSFISALAEEQQAGGEVAGTAGAKAAENVDCSRCFITGHTGWTDNLEFAFAHKNKSCARRSKRSSRPQWRPTMPMTNRMTRRKMQRADF